MNIFRKIEAALLYPMAKSIVVAQSEMKRLKTLGKKSRIIKRTEYNKQKIILIALYQKGRLRDDIVNLLSEAKSQGFYVIAVNTLKLSNPDQYSDILDVYIERPNFGRDFGSYKSGFQFIHKNDEYADCKRLLMCNDSVFYSKKGLSKFLKELTLTDIEVLGATENYEIEYHLGSFCISLSGDILINDKFKKYWRNYRLTDVRPKVIKTGEMQLSKVLKMCTSSTEQFTALYGTAHFSEQIKNNTELQNVAIKFSRQSKLVHWPRFEPISFVREFSSKIPQVNTLDPDFRGEINFDAELSQWQERMSAMNRDEIYAFIFRHITNPTEELKAAIEIQITSNLLDIYRNGSQIHQNASVLYIMGLPIVKLDLLYRGMFNFYDLDNLLQLFERKERIFLSKLLLDRPFGADTMIGWRRSAFLVGLI